MTVWFTKGYRNLYNAISDLKKEHPEINVLCSHSDKLFSGFYSADFSEFEPKFKNKEHFLSFTKEMIQKLFLIINKSGLMNLSHFLMVWELLLQLWQVKIK